ncbi:MAG: urease accessory protein UreF [Planktothrix sp.]
MILNLLQLSSPALPLGAYSYSEGLETLVETQVITNNYSLLQWLIQDLNYGAIRLEAALMVRAYRCVINQDYNQFVYWNQWSTAAKETSELRQQSWQMGNTLIQLLVNLEKVKKTDLELPPLKDWTEKVGKPCNYAIAFGLGAVYWDLDLKNALLGYLYSWATNLINAGVKLIPLGQTMGQTLLLQLHPEIESTATAILQLDDEDLVSCNWGLALASMAHETQYSRLFRS